MKIFLAIKFHEDLSNKNLIEGISSILESKGTVISVSARDLELWGKANITAKELMVFALENIEKSNLLLIEFSEKGVGLGVEAGYAFAKGIPIVVIAKTGSDISNSIAGIAKEVIFYEDIVEIGEKIKKYIL